jgi:hypothetical protein
LRSQAFGGPSVFDGFGESVTCIKIAMEWDALVAFAVQSDPRESSQRFQWLQAFDGFVSCLVLELGPSVIFADHALV